MSVCAESPIHLDDRVASVCGVVGDRLLQVLDFSVSAFVSVTVCVACGSSESRHMYAWRDSWI